MRRALAVAVPGLFGLAMTLASLRPDARPSLIWNATASAPEGLYGLTKIDAPQVGDWVALRPVEPLAGWLDRAGYLPKGALLIKQVAALHPSHVCRAGDLVTVDASPVARALPNDRRGRPLPRWRGCRALGPSDVFLINRAAGSLDSRYLGPLPRTAIVGRAIPVLLIGGSDRAA